MISVIIPMYNSASTIERCLRSVMNQTFDDTEIIVIDDGSKDEGPEIVQTFSKKDPRIRCITQLNGGASRARNRGIEESRGEFLCFVDSDDAIREDYLLQLHRAMIETHSDIAICGYREIRGERDADILLSDEDYSKLRGEINLDLYTLRRFISSPWMKLYNGKQIRAAQLRFREDMALAEDQFFNYQYYALCRNVCFVNWPGYLYYRGDTGLSGVINMKRFMDEMDNLDSMINYMDDFHVVKGDHIIAEYICYCSRRYIFIPGEDNTRKAACQRLIQMNRYRKQVKLSNPQEKLIFRLLYHNLYDFVYWFYRIRRRGYFRAMKNLDNKIGE